MRTKLFIMTAGIILAVLPVSAQQQKEWTLAQCIDYALNENIQVRKAGVTASVGEINLQQAKDNRWPNLSASAGENLGWQDIDVND
jgi:outer membrane protein